MILRLRRVHRSAFVALAILLPALLASAWKVRRAPLVGELPTELLPGLQTPSTPYYILGDDELVYWIEAGDVSSQMELPPAAELVGTVRSGALELSPPPGKRSVTYSLVHRLVNANLKDLSHSRARVGKQP